MSAIVVTLVVAAILFGIAAAIGGPLLGLLVLVPVVIGGGAWIVLAGRSGATPATVVREAEGPELLGPGGPDDPDR